MILTLGNFGDNMVLRKQRIILMAASSVDGKITLPGAQKVKFSTSRDLEILKDIRGRVDCLIRGGETIRKNGSPGLTSKYLQNKRIENRKTRNPVNVVVTASLNFDFSKIDFFKSKEIKRIIFTIKKKNNKFLSEAKKYGEVIELEKNSNNLLDVDKIVKILTNKFGFENMLLEGGGELNFHFIEKNLVDELYLTICPYLIGGDSKSFVGGVGFPADKMKIMKLEKISRITSNEILLIYKIQKDKKIQSINKGNCWFIKNGK